VALSYGIWAFDGARDSLRRVFDTYLSGTYTKSLNG